jgi:hypothetical protein
MLWIVTGLFAALTSRQQISALILPCDTQGLYAWLLNHFCDRECKRTNAQLTPNRRSSRFQLRDVAGVVAGH